MIKFNCSQCSKSLRVEDQFEGRRVQCPKCKHKMRVPALEQDALPSLIDDVSPLQKEVASPLNVVMPSQMAPSPEVEQLDELELLPQEDQEHDAFELEQADDLDLSMSLSDAAAGEASDQNYELAELPAAPKPVKTRIMADMTNSSQPSRTAAGAKAGLQLVGCVIGAGAGALVGAIIWAAIGRATGYEVGYVAWGVGLLAGLGATIGGRGNSPSIAMIAVVMALLGLTVGKVGMISGASESDMDEVMNNRDAMVLFIVMDMAESGEFSPQLQADYKKAVASDFDDVSFERALQFGIADERHDKLNEQQRRELARRMMPKLVEGISFIDKLKATSGFFDILWCILAISTAWKIGIGGEEE